ncbi:MAG: hypothetical protein AAGD25_33560 [Cyanobacteria bacterium P01_F01_bin.150]
MNNSNTTITSINSQKQGNNFIFDRLFSSMNLEDKNSFSEEQIEILRRAAAKLQPKKHAVDVRVSIPLPFREGIYCVLLAGPEKRGKNRIYQERKRFWRLAIPAFSGLALFIILSISTPFILKNTLHLKHANAHPTALPWIQTEKECLGENRFWDADSCWDKQHSERF